MRRSQAKILTWPDRSNSLCQKLNFQNTLWTSSMLLNYI